ncbi:hypothetical protein NHJ13734_009663 [Beauveria thailandica]
MKICIAIPFLAAAALAAPQQQHEALDMKLFKEPTTDSRDKTNGTYRIVNMRSYEDGIKQLELSNRLYNRYSYIRSLHLLGHSDEDKESREMIEKLGRSNAFRGSQVSGNLDAAKKKLSGAFSPEDYGKVEQAINEARAKINKSWKKIDETDINQLSNLDKLFRGETEE